MVDFEGKKEEKKYDFSGIIRDKCVYPEIRISKLYVQLPVMAMRASIEMKNKLLAIMRNIDL